VPVTVPVTAPPTTTPASTQPATTEPPGTTAAPSTPADAATVAEIEAALAAAPAGCDPLDTRQCYLPFPSNAYLAVDPATDTGRRVQFPAAGAPVNAEGVSVDVAEWNRADGFSPNTTILAYVPDLDAVASKLPPWTDLEGSLADSATVVIVDLDTRTRVPLWAEPDARPADDADRTLVIHPAVSLTAGHTYAVGLRGLITAAGTPVEPSAVFRAYRDELTTDIETIEERRPSMESAIAGLVEADVARDELQLAWDFTVASTRSISERMLHIRDETLAGLGEASPAFTITSATDAPLDDGEPLEGVARQIIGTFTAPNWLTGDGSPGNGFQYATDPAADPDTLPVQNGTLEAPFACNIPDAVMAGTEPARISYYGHGLLGSEMEVNAGNLRDFGNAYNTVFCATKWAGMSEDDIPNAVASLQDLSNFPTLTDRLHQGVLNQIVLGRLLLAPDGLTADPAFHRPDGSPLADNSTLVYDGNSQGGIMGLMLAAVSPDVERFVLGVPGINYGVLLPRSVDFDTYETVFEPAYPNDLDRTLLLAMIQMLWDRGEGAGYVHHITDDPLPGTPPKEVLLHVAFGDWQVSELTAYIAARTLGIPIHRPVTADGRSREVEPGWGLDSLEYPSDGSAILVWDSGSDAIPIENVPPSTSRDPHGDPRRDPEVQRQKAGFLFDGEIIDVCQGGPCTAAAN
jgi:hypothetical protein